MVSASLNSVLDTSRIEAGKMILDEEEFNLAQLLEDAVDMFYPMAMKKGVDIVLDPCDGSITTSCNVRGDRGKLKQILSNLLNNAVKFTSEGHITVRATVQPVQETSMENAIINNASNFITMWECFCPVCSHNKKRLKDLDGLRTAQQAPNLTEFVIEVDDTGLGIPKHKRKSVFEHYNQVDISAFRQGGTGLGLGLVQSMVSNTDNMQSKTLLCLFLSLFCYLSFINKQVETQNALKNTETVSEQFFEPKTKN